MSEEAPHKSHATGWIISVVLALVLYLGSAHPVLNYYYSSKGSSWLPRSWERSLDAFYRPALWLWHQPALNKYDRAWADFWSNHY